MIGGDRDEREACDLSLRWNRILVASSNTPALPSKCVDALFGFYVVEHLNECERFPVEGRDGWKL